MIITHLGTACSVLGSGQAHDVLGTARGLLRARNGGQHPPCTKPPKGLSVRVWYDSHFLKEETEAGLNW